MQHKIMSHEHIRECSEKSGECPYVEAATSKAVREVFAILGVNVDVPKDVEEFRASLRFGDAMRKAAGRSMTVLVIFVAGGICAALWLGLKSKFNE